MSHDIWIICFDFFVIGLSLGFTVGGIGSWLIIFGAFKRIMLEVAGKPEEPKKGPWG